MISMRNWLNLGAMLVIPLFAAAGCARYGYDVIRPPEFAGHAPGKTDYVFTRDPLEYHLRSIDSRLVIRIYNPTEDQITLLGGQSSAVDPDGQSHPMLTQTIAPENSFIKLILPPPRPTYYRDGPTIGFGIGTVVSTRHGHHRIVDQFDDEPRYLTAYDDSNALYWDWKGESEVRLTLVYQRGQENFTHDFVIRRIKAK